MAEQRAINGRMRRQRVVEHEEHDTTHVHVTEEEVTRLTLTPPHAPRAETALFRQTRAAILDDDEACFVCGVRPSDLRDSARKGDLRINPFGATQIEAHHVIIERSLTNAIDYERLAMDYPTVRAFASVEEWSDSRHNNRAFCNVCHRTGPHAAHHALWPIVIATKYAKRDEQGIPYIFAARGARDAARALPHDEQIEAPVEAALERALATLRANDNGDETLASVTVDGTPEAR